MNILRQKIIFFSIRISLVALFLFVITRPGILVLNSRFNDKDEFSNENRVESAQKKSCSLIEITCCCGVIVHNNRDCCCKSEFLGNGSRDLAVGTSGNRFLNAIIGSIKCSNIPGDFQIGTLNDYGPSSLNTFLCLLEETGFQTYIQEGHTAEPHLWLPYKPPRNSHNLHL